ncbi:MAG: H/ACA ribonucleoprotein complex subunit GAR1 [Candidatus Heimdallarchaeota archaeon]
MKQLGKVSVIAKNGNVLVRATKTFRVGTKVVNQQLAHIGKIVDIIGPVATPYIVINTRGSKTTIRKSELLYLLDKQQKPLKQKSSKNSKKSSYSSKKKPTRK